jgi:hypothetical protein
MSERSAEKVWEQAEDLAEARGCTPENPCWSECVEAAYNTIESGDLEDWERARIGRAEGSDHA